MHTYIKIEETWAAGHYQLVALLMTGGAGGNTVHPPQQIWRQMKSFGSEKEAAAYVNYLNGGDGKTL